MDVMSNTMRGLGKTTTAMVMSISDSCIFRIIWARALCARIPTPTTLYWVYPVSWALTFGIYVAAYFPTMKRIKRNLGLDNNQQNII